MYKCLVCEKEYQNKHKFLGHCSAHSRNKEKILKPAIAPKLKIKENWRQENGLYQCPYCEIQKTKNGIATHIWRTHGEGKEFSSNTGYANGSREIWNKGLTKETDSRLIELNKKSSETKRRLHKEGLIKKPSMSSERREQLSIRQSLNNSGGKCKWFEVSGQKVQGTWERDIALKLEEFQIVWYKPRIKKDTFKYVDDIGKGHSYSPDFYLKDLNLLLEIKGYWWGDDKRKMRLVLEQNPNLKIKLIQKKEFEGIISSKNKEELLKFVNEANWVEAQV